MKRPAVIVLVGPPGSGKTSVGEELGRLGFRWRDREEDLVGRWGSREAFVANKDEALRKLHQQIMADICANGPPLVIESTGLSEKPFLDELEHRFSALFVRLDVPIDVARSRLAARQPGRNLNREPEAAEATFAAFAQLVRPLRRIDLAIEMRDTSPAAAAQAIAAFIAQAVASVQSEE